MLFNGIDTSVIRSMLKDYINYKCVFYEVVARSFTVHISFARPSSQIKLELGRKQHIKRNKG